MIAPFARRVGLIGTILIATVVPATVSYAESAEQRFHQADAAISDQKIDEGLAILHALAVDSQAAHADRFKAFQKVWTVQLEKKKDREGAIATIGEMISAFPGDDELLRQIYFTQASLLLTAHKTDQAIEAYHQVVTHAKDDKETAVQARLRAAAILQSGKDYAQLYEEGTQLLRLLGDDRRAGDALWYMSEAAWRLDRCQDSLDRARRIVADFPHAAVWENRKAHERVVECLRKLDQPGGVRAFYEEWEKKDPDAQYRQKWCLALAASYAAETNTPAALAAYRRVITGHCGDRVSDCWCDAQSKIVDLLANSGEFSAALQESHILLDVCRPNTVGLAVSRIASLFIRLDKDRARGDRFVAYQHYGPAGPDGKPGTEDDLTNPLDEIGYPADSERQQALTWAFAALGSDAAAAHQRGILCLYLGQPKPALYYFMDAVRRCDIEKFPEFAVSLIANGLRAVRGHSVGLDLAQQYLLYGPHGEDGKPGTADDLTDPFAPYASFQPAPPFVVLPLAAKDIQLLKQLQASLMASAVDLSWPAELRGKALVAVARLNETLDTWPQQADWYRNLLLHDASSTLKRTILQGAISASRGQVLHLGNVWAFLASLDSIDTTHDKHLAQEVEKAGHNFRKQIYDLAHLTQPHIPLPPHKHSKK
jgi:tetratricopeptide (TPR) repeat protein